jgi:fructokinase
MSRRVFAIGETVYDIIFQDGAIKAGTPGGSMLNTSVSLGRLGVDVHFISETGNDELGELIKRFLEANGVKTGYFSQFKNGQTPVALAVLDEHQNARYSFYKNYPKQRMQLRLPEIDKGDVVLFGSFFSISPAVRTTVVNLLDAARQAGAIIIYDPNIRSPHKRELPELMNYINQNFNYADIVRASDEDMRTIFAIDKVETVYERVNESGPASLILTRGADPVTLMTGSHRSEFPVTPLNVVSTVGAGDSFNAGIVHSILEQHLHRDDLQHLDISAWDKIIASGIKLSSNVCMSFGNYYDG